MAEPKVDGELFDIHVIGDVTGKTWSGKFRAKAVLSLRDRLTLDRYRRELLGMDGNEATPESRVTSAVIASLSVRLTQVPEWWSSAQGGLDLADYNVVEAVFAKAAEIEADHRKKVEEEGAAAQAKLRENK